MYVNTRPQQNPPYLPHSIPQMNLRNFAGYVSDISTLGEAAKSEMPLGRMETPGDLLAGL